MFIPMKDGKNFVDIAPFTDAGADTRGKVDGFKFLRDQCVASLGIPASFLNIEENLSNKCLDLHEKIRLLSSGVITIKELIDEFNEFGELKDRWTYCMIQNLERLLLEK